MDVLGDALRRRFHVADIRLLVRVERRRHANRDGVDVRDELKIARRTQAARFDLFLQGLADNVADIVVAGVDHVDLRLLHVEADRFIPCAREFHRQRQADVA